MSCMEHCTELYRTKQGVIYQDNKRFGYLFDWKGETVFLKLPWYYSLKRQIEALDLEAFMLARHDFEVLTACGCSRVFLLTAAEALEVKELFAGAKAMIELNSIVHECLSRRMLFA